MIGYFVSGAAAVVKDDTGKIRYLYEGAAVPSGVPQSELDRLEALGLLEQIELPDVLDAIVEGADGVQHTGTIPASLALNGQDTGGAAPELRRPATVANKATWLDYRVALGQITAEQRAEIETDGGLEVTVKQLQDDAFMDDWPTSATGQAAS